MPPDLAIEETLWSQGFEFVAGVDEAGRGPLAGPVVAAAVIVPVNAPRIKGINDSKKLSPARREELSAEIRRLYPCHIAEISSAEIDRINILQASLLAMRHAIEGLESRAEFVLVDGNKQIPMGIPQRAVVKGDSLSYSIAAASILAKVHRDHLMEALHARYPEYGFDGHKGYPTESHRKAIERLGPCPEHRRTFRGVKEFLGKEP